jgi:hypothetical protein
MILSMILIISNFDGSMGNFLAKVIITVGIHCLQGRYVQRFGTGEAGAGEVAISLHSPCRNCVSTGSARSTNASN